MGGVASTGDESGQSCACAAALGEPDSVTFTATAAYPYINRERAVLGLRAQLREAAANADQDPDWSTFGVEGPVESPGRHGVTWYEWTATVEPVSSR